MLHTYFADALNLLSVLLTFSDKKQRLVDKMHINTENITFYCYRWGEY